MKIALIQTNPIIGDFTSNCEQILDGAREAARSGCRLAVFPEMSVTGYPPQDLLERGAFIEQQQRAVASLVADLPDIDVLFGCFEKRQGVNGKGLYNAAVVARGGKIVYRARKQLLPSYDVFDERRYFEPGEPPDFYRVGGLTFGVTVCEDIWDLEIHEYKREPVKLLFDRAAKQNERLDALINISASPFQRRKERRKIEMFQQICTSHGIPLIYVNQVGGQDSLLFDGRSLVIDGTGDVRAKGRAFARDVIIIDSDGWKGDFSGAICDDELASIYDGLVMGVRDYVSKCGFQKWYWDCPEGSIRLSRQL